MRNAAGAVVGTNQSPAPAVFGQYNTNPNWYDIQVWNWQWTHKDTTSVPYMAFGVPATCNKSMNCANATHGCPYCADHGCKYDDGEAPDGGSALAVLL